uniref:Uncharacterized protein LOC100176714 n=1 Tax=Phallusia mammillata TaxID=59560 RepID=A0A6F9DFZ9_9ASCI|nr:uncharacterized protein LOC100176714 [Phallusia mammillata]
MNTVLGKVALGIAVVGTIGVNVGYNKLQKIHRNRDYCTLPLKALAENKYGIQLLGGSPIKVKYINLRLAKIGPQQAKLTIPVQGNTRKGEIFTLSSRENPDASWFLEYAVMRITQGGRKWVVWLHPVDKTDVDVPEEIEQAIS